MMAISNITVHESLPTGGYEDQLFLDLPSESPHCPVCLLVVREPHVLLCCGTRICQVSILKYSVNHGNLTNFLYHMNNWGCHITKYYTQNVKFLYSI